VTTRYFKRDMEKVLKSASRQFPSVIVAGPRQSGKTTLLKHVFSGGYRYASMDDPELRLMAVKEPSLFFENYPPPVIIDEIQYAPQLFPYIKMIIDKNRSSSGRFILTGSQLFPLMANVGESLAGRIAVFTLLSFSIKEQFGSAAKLSIHKLKEKALKGGFPELAVGRRVNPELWFASYLQTYLERDVRNLRQMGDLSDFQRFLQLITAFNGQVLNMSSISRDMGVAVNTVKAWVSILEASGQIMLVKPFYINRGKRIVKSPKLYFLDTGILCYLAGINSATQVFKGYMAGQMLETIVLGEIVRNSYNQGKIPRIFWWRTSGGEEVDFILEHGDKIIPIEVKMSSAVNKNTTKNLASFCDLFSEKVEKAFLVNFSREKVIAGKGLVVMPFNDFMHYVYTM